MSDADRQESILRFGSALLHRGIYAAFTARFRSARAQVFERRQGEFLRREPSAVSYPGRRIALEISILI
jgi:hypothetical protein